MDPRYSQVVRAAELYYDRNLGQQEIAKILGISRPTVSRLLAEARENGVVQITIERLIEKNAELAEQLRLKFDLRDAVVVAAGGDYGDALKRVGEAAAELLVSILEDNIIIGISWGQTLYHTVQALDDTPMNGIEVIQMTGALGYGDPSIDGPELALRLAERLHGSYRYVNAPAVVGSGEIRDILWQQPQIRQTLERAAQAKIMMMGIGSLADNLSSLQRAGYLTEEERLIHLSVGAVGHLLARMIDRDGDEVEAYNQRVVAIPFEYLRQAKWSIGISASSLKAPAVLGALRGRYFNTLVIDEESALEILRLAEKS
ncbi:MAG: Deoxyribonucleoside regulator [Anaerolineae bacterium]|nr:Deoxyribonucleoside regulator [Anaerolineae bacterium]